MRCRMPTKKKPEANVGEDVEEAEVIGVQPGVPPFIAVGLAGVKAIMDIAKRFGLTDKQARFVISYWTGGHNATKAARAAGYSAKSIRAQASQLLGNPKVKRAIAAVAAQQGIRIDILHARLLEIALEADVRDFEKWLNGEETLQQTYGRGINTKLVKSAKARVTTRMVDGEPVVTETRQVTLHDPLKAISLLLPALDATAEVEALERGPEYDYTVGDMLTKEFLEQVPKSLIAGILGIRSLPSPRKKT